MSFAVVESGQEYVVTAEVLVLGLHWHTGRLFRSDSQASFYQADGSSMEETARKLEKHLLERYPELEAILYPYTAKTALERILAEDKEGPFR